MFPYTSDELRISGNVSIGMPKKLGKQKIDGHRIRGVIIVCREDNGILQDNL